MGAKSGLRDALEVLKGVPGVGTVNFSEADVVRHPLVTKIVKAYGARDRDMLDRAAERRKKAENEKKMQDQNER